MVMAETLGLGRMTHGIGVCGKLGGFKNSDNSALAPSHKNGWSCYIPSPSCYSLRKRVQLLLVCKLGPPHAMKFEKVHWYQAHHHNPRSGIHRSSPFHFRYPRPVALRTHENAISRDP
jgi:hypothetical protein